MKTTHIIGLALLAALIYMVVLHKPASLVKTSRPREAV